MSQNSALPSLTALALSLMYAVSSGGVGTGIVSSAATRGRARAPTGPAAPPAAIQVTRPASAIASAIAARSATRRPVPAATAAPPPTMNLRTNFHPHGQRRPIPADVSSMPIGYKAAARRSTGSSPSVRGPAPGVQEPRDGGQRSRKNSSIHRTSTASSNLLHDRRGHWRRKSRTGRTGSVSGVGYDQGVGSGRLSACERRLRRGTRPRSKHQGGGLRRGRRRRTGEDAGAAAGRAAARPADAANERPDGTHAADGRDAAGARARRQRLRVRRQRRRRGGGRRGRLHLEAHHGRRPVQGGPRRQARGGGHQP